MPVTYLPMMVKDERIGMLAVWGPDLREADYPAFAVFAFQAATAIEQARLYEDSQRKLRELNLMNAIATTIIASSNEDELITQATQIVGTTFYPDNLGILLVDNEAGVLRPHYSYQDTEVDLSTITVPLGQGVTGKVVATGQSYLVSDIRQEPGYVGLP